MSSLPDRFWAKVRKTDSCWLWTAKTNNRGYGMISVGGRAGGMRLAHRVSYEMSVGPIPDGLVIDHLCNTPLCVNPDHLRAVTQRANVLRGESPQAANARATHCVNGHEFTPENTRHRRNGWRCCVTCKRARDAERRQRKTVEHLATEGAA